MIFICKTLIFNLKLFVTLISFFLSRGKETWEKKKKTKWMKQREGIQLECAYYALWEASLLGFELFAMHHLDFLGERAKNGSFVRGGINQRERERERAQLGVLKQLVITNVNADSRRLNTTIYTHVPLHDIDSTHDGHDVSFERGIHQSRAEN